MMIRFGKKFLWLWPFILFLFPKILEATPSNRFPYYLSHTVVLRLTGCMNSWLQDEINYIFRDLAGSGDDLCPPGQHTGGGSFSGANVSCAYKTLNFINAILMDLLDQQDNTPVECCCDPNRDSENCTGPATTGCPTQFPNRASCMALKPEATNYYVIQGYQAWATGITSMPGNVTVYWKGLLDQCLPVPLMGTMCLNISLDDVCNGASCGPVSGYNGTTHPGFCAYPPYTGNLDANVCDDNLYQSASRDRFILSYDVANGVVVNFTVGESSGISCGMGPANYNYNGKVFTGNEGFLTIDLQLGAAGNPLRIDIDAATPSPGNRKDFGNFQIAPNRATNVAPGKGDCDPNTPWYQGDCYVRAYLQASGALKLALGATLYLEHRTDNWPHMQDIGIAVRSIDFSAPPWISLQLDWRWTESGCTAPSTTCRRRDITIKAAKLIEFVDLVLRGLFRYDWIPSSLQQYFGPVVFDITDLVQQKIDYIAPTWSRPVTADTLKLDISMGGEPVLGTNVLRSKSCFANTGVGLATNRNELYLIAHGMIDTDLFRQGFADDFNHILPSCGYLGAPTHPAFTPAAFPTQFPHLPHAGSSDSASLASCESSGTFVGISFHQNIFSHLVSDIASSGVMCLAIHKDGQGLFSSLPVPIFTVGQAKLLIPDLYNFLESEFGPDVTDIPLIFVIKPKFVSAYPGFPNVPQADLVPDTSPWNPLPITGDVLLTLPNNDVEIWVDVDNVVEQWGYGPGDSPTGTCTIGTTPASTGWCQNFNTYTTAPGRIQIDRPPAGNANDFINNFPDCVSFIDCDTTIGNPTDRPNERRFIAQFNVGVTLGLDLNLYGCGRLSGKVFGNLSSWGFSTTWYNPWNPSTAGNCTNVSHLRRVDLTVGVVSRVGTVSVFNEASVVRSYYPFSGGTFNAFLADAIAVLLSSQLALDAQVGYTLSPIIDPNDDLYNAVAANNNVLRIGGHTKGGTATVLTHTYITRDDIGNGNPDPAPAYQQSFLTIAIDLQGIIHPNFIYNTISSLMGGSTDLLAPPIFGATVGNFNKLQLLISRLEDLKRRVDSGQEVSFKIGVDEIKKIVRDIEDRGYVVPTRRQNLVDDFPPEVIVDWVDARTERTVIKLSCIDDRTASNNCWYSWRWAGGRGLWRQWQQSDQIEIKGLPDGVYSIEVRALDEMGLPDVTPAVVSFIVDDNAPSLFFPRESVFKKGEVIQVEVWDYITSPDKIMISWKIGDEEWSDWSVPDYVENGRGKKFIRLPYKEGDYVLYVRAKDNKGNQDVSSFKFSVGKRTGIFGCGRI